MGSPHFNIEFPFSEIVVGFHNNNNNQAMWNYSHMADAWLTYGNLFTPEIDEAHKYGIIEQCIIYSLFFPSWYRQNLIFKRRSNRSSNDMALNASNCKLMRYTARTTSVHISGINRHDEVQELPLTHFDTTACWESPFDIAIDDDVTIIINNKNVRFECKSEENKEFI